MDESDFDDDEFDMDDAELPPVPEPKPDPPKPEPPKAKAPEPDDDDDDDVGDDPASMFADGTLKAASVTRAVIKPWMKHHKFVLLSTVEEVVKLVDEAIEAGECSLDLETQGFDNRINYDENGAPSTPHKIVGYCMSVDGVTGYYLPVRHRPDPLTPDVNPNIPDVKAVEEQIKRLCLASQPTLDPESAKEDPLAGKVAVPGKVVICFWHSKFDQEFLYPVTGIDYWHPSSFQDGMLAAFTIFSGDKRIGLKPKAKQLLRTPDDEPYEMVEMKELFERGQTVDFASLDPASFGVKEYVGGDGICTLLLCRHPEITKAWKDKKFSGAYQMEKKVVQVCRVMDRNRVKIDLKEVAILIEEAKIELAETEKRIVDVAKSVGFKDFNPGSPPQVSDLLFTSKGFDLEPKPPLTKAAEKAGSQQYSTSADILEKLAEAGDAPDILVDIVKWRQIDKIIGTYLEGMLHDVDEFDQLRFDFKQTGTTTGRFSAPAGKSDHGGTSIPIHGIPARKDPKRPKVAHSLRRLFISRPGYTIVKSDYAGQELRIVTNLSQEPVWLKEFIHGTGDLHTITAQAFFGAHITRDDTDKRKMGKAANFALVYGGGPAAIMRATGCNKQEARRRKQNFDKKVSKFATWVKGQHAYVKTNLGVKTASGRWISIPDAACKEGTKDSMGRFLNKEDANKLRAACERYSTNYPIQGCLQPSARILTDHGYLTIAELSRQKDCRVWTGTNWASFQLRDMGPWQYAEIELADGTLIPCDTRHKVLVFSEHGYIWKDFSDLCVGDMVATSIPKPVTFPELPLPPLVSGERSTHTPVMPPDNEGDLWFWLGYYFGDGWKGDDGLHYIFGAHETAKMDQCVGFWRRWGLNPTIREATHQPHEKVSTRYIVSVHSVDLVRWLDELGIPAATAHTKRLSSRIFSGLLVNRQQFVLGLMSSDGHRTTNGDPYSIHLCQKELLRDVKLLLRTLGVDSTLYGPYTYKGQVSYRLDINQRMFRSAVEHTSARLPKMVDLYAPSFLIDELLEVYPEEKRSAFPNESLYNLYLRMRSGGTVTLITFQHMLDTMGWTITQPVYGYQRVKETRTLSQEGPTFTLSVQDEGHRFECEGAINKNTGADVLKVSFILLHREFYKRGWLKNGLDCARILLNVHDEIVFEIRDDMAQEIMEVIEFYMEEYSRMVGWEVPLIVEPLLGRSWAATYDWRQMKYGEAYEDGQEIKDSHFRQGDKVYAKSPDWLTLKFDHGASETQAEPPKPSASFPKRKEPPKVAIFKINKLDEVSVQSVCLAAMKARFPETNPVSVLHLVDIAGNTLIGPDFRGIGLKIDAEVFGQSIREQNLGTGVPGLLDDN